MYGPPTRVPANAAGAESGKAPQSIRICPTTAVKRPSAVGAERQVDSSDGHGLAAAKSSLRVNATRTGLPVAREAPRHERFDQPQLGTEAAAEDAGTDTDLVQWQREQLRDLGAHPEDGLRAREQREPSVRFGPGRSDLGLQVALMNPRDREPSMDDRGRARERTAPFRPRRTPYGQARLPTAACRQRNSRLRRQPRASRRQTRPRCPRAPRRWRGRIDRFANVDDLGKGLIVNPHRPRRRPRRSPRSRRAPAPTG